MAAKARGFGALPIAAVLAVVLAAAPSALAVRPGHGAPPRHGKPVEPTDQHSVVQSWARSLGKEVTDMARSVTRFDRLQESIKKLGVEAKDPERLLNDVARSMEKLMQRRVNQVQKIRMAAEEVGRLKLREHENMYEIPQFYLGVKDFASVEVLKSKGWTTTPEPATTTTPAPVKSVMSVLCPAFCADEEVEAAPPNTTQEAPTTPKPWLVDVAGFPGTGPVNVSMSAVHVPTTLDDGSNINPDDLENYEKDLNSTGADSQRIIELTNVLDETFRSNMKEDWSTSWQFFAHHTGIMRQYPASKWNRDFADDFFDARMRPWYLRAASSPKDVVILLDNSGSILMTEPKLYTKVVAHYILESLTPDDFVTVLVYNNSVQPLLPGLDKTLIPATSANIRELQFSLENLNPNGSAVLKTALNYSLLLLDTYRRESSGASCNQAIMVITDLVAAKEVEVFRQHNLLGPANAKQTKVRIFTFVIGDKKENTLEAQWTACASKGWFERIWKKSSPMPVLNFMHVMARPMVLKGAHPVHWSHMYADVTVAGITDKLWLKMEADEQLRRITPYCWYHKSMHHGKYRHQVHVRPPITDGPMGQTEQFVVTVSVPVHNLSAEGLAEGALLGVAGIDVPVSQLTALIAPHKVGVNAYIFMVSNNGLVVFHPELRPMFNGILKPGFNSLDMSEVEQEDVPNPRNLSEAMQNFREQVVKQYKGSIVLTVRQSYRNWRRMARQARRYYFQGVDNTPYSLVMATPLEYGAEGIKSSHDGSLTSAKLLSLLGAEWSPHGGWQVHPNWTYCGCCGLAGRPGLDSLSLRGHSCDRELANALAMDADATRFYAEKIKDTSMWDRWEVEAAFVATHSGLTRWAVMPINDPMNFASQMPPVTPRGPDEPWFKRAVTLAWTAAATESDAKVGPRGGAPQPGAAPHWVVTVPMQDEENADVYSEYNAAYDVEDPWAARRAGLADSWKSEDMPNTTEQDAAERIGQRLITLTTALFRGKVPAGVTGVTFPVRSLQDVFVRTTTRMDILSCTSEELDCYLLDENAIVVADKTGADVGRPLALVNNDLTARLEAAHVLERVTVHDVQGVCRRLKNTAAALTPSWASSLLGTAALAALWWTGTAGATGAPRDVMQAVHPLYTVATAAVMLGTVGKALPFGSGPKVAGETHRRRYPRQFMVNHTILQLCDMKMHLHRVVRAPSLHQHHRASQIQLGCGGANSTRQGDRPFMVATVPGTNLILVVALNTCPKAEQLDPFRSEPWEDAVPKGSPVFRKVGAQWPRRRPSDCYSRHDKEPTCGPECKAFCGDA